jgi:ferrous iron transport protein A
MAEPLIALDKAALSTPFAVHELVYANGASDWAQRLEELGFLPGERVVVLRRAPAGEPLAVRVGHTTYALRRAEGACIRVRPWEGGVAG